MNLAVSKPVLLEANLDSATYYSVSNILDNSITTVGNMVIP